MGKPHTFFGVLLVCFLTKHTPCIFQRTDCIPIKVHLPCDHRHSRSIRAPHHRWRSDQNACRPWRVCGPAGCLCPAVPLACSRGHASPAVTSRATTRPGADHPSASGSCCARSDGDTADAGRGPHQGPNECCGGGQTDFGDHPAVNDRGRREGQKYALAPGSGQHSANGKRSADGCGEQVSVDGKGSPTPPSADQKCFGRSSALRSTAFVFDSQCGYWRYFNPEALARQPSVGG